MLSTLATLSNCHSWDPQCYHVDALPESRRVFVISLIDATAVQSRMRECGKRKVRICVRRRTVVDVRCQAAEYCRD